MIKFHPHHTELVSFAEGTLSCASSLIVSAHCDMCETCDIKVHELTELTAESALSNDVDVEFLTRDYISMFESITRDKTLVDNNIVSVAPQSILVDGRNLNVPETLTRISSKVGEWSHLVGKLWQAPIEIRSSALVQLVYMEKGGSVPEHTHKGNEISLVLNGQFQDGNNSYSSGDYVALDQSHTHMPVANSEDGCLVLTVLDKPLHFTTGWAKLINPLSQIYFNSKIN
jgi:putative transcriptional regulator